MKRSIAPKPADRRSASGKSRTRKSAGRAPLTARRQLTQARPAMMPADRVAGALGWLSVALGFVELLAPRALSRALGASKPTLVRSYGVRELAAGMGILAGRRTGFWLWARVIGDALDLASLARTTLRRGNPRRGLAITALGSVVFITLLDLYCAQIFSETTPDDHEWRR